MHYYRLQRHHRHRRHSVDVCLHQTSGDEQGDRHDDHVTER